MANLTDKQRVERALPSYLLLGVLMQGADHKDGPGAIAAKEALVQAAGEALTDLPKPARDKLNRRIVRLHDLVTKPYREKRARVDKLGLVTFYAIGALIDEGRLELRQDSALQKGLTAMAGALLQARGDRELDAAAKAEAPEFVSQLKRLGYYGGVGAHDRSMEREAGESWLMLCDA